MSIESISPMTGETLATYESLDAAGIELRLERATAAFATWRKTRLDQRAILMTRAAGVLESGAERFGRLMTLEMGKPLRAAIDEVLKCAKGCRYYAENAAHFLADEKVATEAKQSY